MAAACRVGACSVRIPQQALLWLSLPRRWSWSWASLGQGQALGKGNRVRGRQVLRTPEQPPTRSRGRKPSGDSQAPSLSCQG